MHYVTCALSLRNALPNKLIGYTLPDSSDYPPFREVASFAYLQLDYITLYRANQEQVSRLEDKGVPREKIVWGIPIGCNSGRADDMPLANAVDVVRTVKKGGYAGITTWSLNRDTNHRFLQAEGECNELQTGEPDASFINAIANELA